MSKNKIFRYLCISFFSLIGIIVLPNITRPIINMLANLSYSQSVGPHSAVKNGLANGIKECVIRNADSQSTKFSDVQSFSEKYQKFKIESLDLNSCFKARAINEDNKQTWFEIDLDPETGNYSKTCGDASKPGCEEGNIW